MSELRIGLVSEGPTDKIVIEAALTAILPQGFVLNALQPEATRPEFGGGWGGVLKWCQQVGKQDLPIEDVVILEQFDLLIIHLDVDVAGFKYADISVDKDSYWHSLPCQKPCPPAKDSAQMLVNVIGSWLFPATIGSRTILCLPAQAIDAWVLCTCLADEDRSLAAIECKKNPAQAFSGLPKRNRIKKGKRDYLKKSPFITKNWSKIKSLCSQACEFEQDVLTAFDYVRNRNCAHQ